MRVKPKHEDLVVSGSYYQLSKEVQVGGGYDRSGIYQGNRSYYNLKKPQTSSGRMYNHGLYIATQHLATVLRRPSK